MCVGNRGEVKTDNEVKQGHCSRFFHQLLLWQINIKGCAFARLAIGINKAIVIFNNFFTDSQANTRPRVFKPAMQPLEQIENFFIVFSIKANTVICKNQVMVLSTRICVYMSDSCSLRKFGPDNYTWCQIF